MSTRTTYRSYIDGSKQSLALMAHSSGASCCGCCCGGDLMVSPLCPVPQLVKRGVLVIEVALVLLLVRLSHCGREAAAAVSSQLLPTLTGATLLPFYAYLMMEKGRRNAVKPLLWADPFARTERQESLSLCCCSWHSFFGETPFAVCLFRLDPHSHLLRPV